MKIGTLVMVKKTGPLAKSQGLYSGAIGEIVQGDEYLRAGCVAVLFPHCPPRGPHPHWQTPPSNLIPLGDPDADISTQESDSDYLKKPEKQNA